MKSKFTEEEKTKCVEYYQDGTGVKMLCKRYQVSKSTMYNWIHDYSTTKAPSGEYVMAKRLYELEKRLDRINRENDIFRHSGCMPQSPLEQRIQAIIRLKDAYNIRVLCDTLEVRRSTVYHRMRRSPEKSQLDIENEILCERIQDIYEKCRGRMGSKKIRFKLVEEGFAVSSERVSNLMKSMNLQSPIRIHKRKRPQVDSPIRQNYLQRQFIQIAPNLVWVSDVTFLNVNGVLYAICAIMDLFSRKIIGYEVSGDSGQALILSAFQKACQDREIKPELIFHSDQGGQYLSNDFQYLLRKHHITQSLSRAGCPYDNAVIESFFSCLKSEELNRNVYHSFNDLKASVDDYIHFYNNDRPHQTLKYQTPQAVENEYYLKQQIG